MRGKSIVLLLTVVCLLCGCGKNPVDTDASSKAEETTAETTTEEQTEAPTTTVAATEPQEAENPDMDGSITAHLWEEYDLAFEYPSAYSVVPDDSETEGVEVLSAETGSTADGVLKMVVSKGSYTTDTFAGLEKIDIINMMGLDSELLVSGTFGDAELPHLSGVDAVAKKFTTKCEYDGIPAELTVLVVNCFDTDCFYALEFVSTDDDYNDFCQNLEEHFYLGNCEVHGGVVKQYLKGKSEKTQKIEMGSGVSFLLPADWREQTADEDTDDDDFEYVTAEGDYLLFSVDDSMPDESFEILMDTQTVGSGSGGLTVTDKEARTVNGCPAYLIHQTRPSWGLSDAETVPVITWYINADSGFIMISMIDVSGTQTDFILHPEEYLEF